MNILLTGGHGFIAKNLREKLDSSFKITSFGRCDFDLLDSKRVWDILKKQKFDVVIHTANYDAAAVGSVKNPQKVLELNLRMFFNLLRCQEYFGKMIYFGSGAEFSREHWQAKMKESYFDQYPPKDSYGYSKYLMTKAIQNNEKIINLRLFGVFGKYDDWQTRLIPNVCYQTVTSNKVVVNQNKAYDFLFVEDLARIVAWFLNHQSKHNVYNVCTGQIVDFKILAQKIIKLSGKKMPLIVEKRVVGQKYGGDNQRLLKEISGFAFTSLDQSLATVWNYFKNKNLYK